MKAEVERLTRENNELHITMIKVKEESQTKLSQLALRVKELEGKESDLHFALNQKQSAIANLESDNARLQSAENKDPNASQFNEFQKQSEIWAEELRRADERCAKFKKDLT